MSEPSTNHEPLLPEMELVLAEPIEFAGKVHTSVVLREPKAREVQQALAALSNATTPDSMIRYNTVLMSAVSGLQRQVIEQLPLRQFNAGAAYLNRLSDSGPATGAA